MCGHCGCGESHETETRLVHLERRVLSKNDALAAENRRWFAERAILALNVVSSPGAGKTTLLERTIRDLADDLPVFVLEGDQATDHDAARIRLAGARAVQINTGTGCHLDASMIARAVPELAPARGSLLLVENVGNLVCPALFDLGERAKVLVASVTEGEDKPEKYPHMFRAAELVLLNKIDLALHVGFDPDRFLASARAVNPRLRVLPISARTGDGLDAWYEWVRARVPSHSEAREERGDEALEATQVPGVRDEEPEGREHERRSQAA